MAAQYVAQPWLNSRRRPDDGFVEFVIRSLPKKDDRAEALNMARAYIRKVDTVQGRLEAVEQLWEDYQAEVEKKRQAEQAKADEAERAKWMRSRF